MPGEPAAPAPADGRTDRHGVASRADRAVVTTRFLVVLTDVRPLTAGARNERVTPERRRQVVGAASREAADRIAGAFMALGMVRARRQRVKVIAVGRRRTADRPDPA